MVELEGLNNATLPKHSFDWCIKWLLPRVAELKASTDGVYNRISPEEDRLLIKVSSAIARNLRKRKTPSKNDYLPTLTLPISWSIDKLPIDIQTLLLEWLLDRLMKSFKLPTPDTWKSLPSNEKAAHKVATASAKFIIKEHGRIVVMPREDAHLRRQALPMILCKELLWKRIGQQLKAQVAPTSPEGQDEVGHSLFSTSSFYTDVVEICEWSTSMYGQATIAPREEQLESLISGLNQSSSPDYIKGQLAKHELLTEFISSLKKGFKKTQMERFSAVVEDSLSPNIGTVELQQRQFTPKKYQLKKAQPPRAHKGLGGMARQTVFNSIRQRFEELYKDEELSCTDAELAAHLDTLANEWVEELDEKKRTRRLHATLDRIRMLNEDGTLRLLKHHSHLLSHHSGYQTSHLPHAARLDHLIRRRHDGTFDPALG